MQLLDYLNLREAFETDGVFDENRPETVNASPEKIADYKVYNNKYDQNNTNVYYWLGDLRDNTYVTNMKETKTQEDAYDQAVKYGRYLSYNNKTFRFETNIGGMENNYYQNMAQYNELQKGDFSLIVAVDVKFPWHVISVSHLTTLLSHSQRQVLESFLDSAVHKDLPV